jgi:hypothetical protein
MNDLTKLGLMILTYGVMLWVAIGISAWLTNHFSSSLTVNKTNNVKPITVITAKQNYHKRAA